MHGDKTCRRLLVKFVLCGASPGSAGVGRSGTLIMLDIQIKRLVECTTIDIYNDLVKLRKERNLLVQTEVRTLIACADHIVNWRTQLPCRSVSVGIL